ncbi:MAG: hypothetical protein KAJ19_19845, partial [Gammaproteobacteria bacterium]|nr:hypothetical protein [Gammaproteobacteria bacterium]
MTGADSAVSIRLETSVSQIKFNIEFPDNIYLSIPKVNGDINFALDYNGEPKSPADRPVLSPWQAISSHVASPLSLPSADFDPSQSQLTFAAENNEILPSSDFTTVQIFADDYFLGKIDLIDPFGTNCARSPDG